MISYSSYLPKKSDLVNNGFMTGFLNCGFSMLSGIMIFSILGNMATLKDVDVSDVVSDGVGLAFMTIPEAINQLPAPWLFGSLFFLSLTIAGISSAISIMEVFIISFHDKFGWERKKIVAIMVPLGFVISILYTSRAGIHRLGVVDTFINNFGIIFAALAEVILLTWFFKIDIIKKHVNLISDFKVGRIWEYSLKILVPIILLIAISAAIVEEMALSGKALQINLVFGWAVIAGILIISFILQAIKGKNQHIHLHSESEDPVTEGEKNDN
ncbi:MAG: hypothetical protein JXR63_07260 [Spirochaetales bacterium]|nr:hypothetical protein [Spirochaetales bacterium]